MKHFTLSVAALLCMGATAYAQRFAPAKNDVKVIQSVDKKTFLPEYETVYAWDAESNDYVLNSKKINTYNEDGSLATCHEITSKSDFLHKYKYDEKGFLVEDLYQYEKVAGKGYEDYAYVRQEFDHENGDIQMSQEAARYYSTGWDLQGMSTWKRLVERDDNGKLLTYTQKLLWKSAMDPNGTWYIMERTKNEYDADGNQTRYTFQTQNGYEEGTTDYNDLSKIVWQTHYDVKTTAWDRNNGNVTARSWISTQTRAWEELFTSENRLLSGVTVNDNGDDYATFKATYTGEDYSIDYVYPEEVYEGKLYYAEIDRFSRELTDTKATYKVEAWQDADQNNTFAIFAGSAVEEYNYDQFGLLVDYSYTYTDAYETSSLEDGLRSTITYNEESGLPETVVTERYNFDEKAWVPYSKTYYSETADAISNVNVEAPAQPSTRFFDLMGRRASNAMKGNILIDQNGKKFIK